MITLDASLTITYKAKFKDGRLAQVGFYLFNKSASQIADITADIEGTDGLRFKESKNPFILDAGAQGLLLFLCECYAPFTGSPLLRLSYTFSCFSFCPPPCCIHDVSTSCAVSMVVLLVLAFLCP